MTFDWDCYHEKSEPVEVDGEEIGRICQGCLAALPRHFDCEGCDFESLMVNTQRAPVAYVLRMPCEKHRSSRE